MSKILIGNWLMVLCSICYLAWWLIVFKPPAPKGNFVGTVFLILAFVTGIGGVFFTIKEMAAPTEEVLKSLKSAKEFVIFLWPSQKRCPKLYVRAPILLLPVKPFVHYFKSDFFSNPSSFSNSSTGMGL